MRFKFILFIFFGYGLTLEAQTLVCGTPLLPKSLPTEKIFLEEEVRFQTFLQNANRLSDRAAPIIPVVVHILYHTASENISDEQVIQQIKILNREFARLNPDTTKTPAVWKIIATDGGVQFCLVTRDPFGNPTTGILHTYTGNETFANTDGVKLSATGGESAWDAKRYLNIWVANIGSNTFGISTFPTDLAASPAFDGIVVNSKCFGVSPNNFPNRNSGRTLVHEAGHWLNLFHTFGNSTTATCASDFVDDTPPQHKVSNADECPNFPRFDDCSFSGNGIMFSNYMNYVADSCYNLFTKGQKERMIAALQLYRSDILNQPTLCHLTGVGDSKSFAEIKVYPNPSSDGTINVEMVGMVSEKFDITVFDISGRIIQQRLKVAQQNSGFQITDLMAGYYILQVKTSIGIAIQRFLFL